MEQVTITLRRYDPDTGVERLESHRVTAEPGATVLEALLEIYAATDSTLAFDFGCRYGRCGLCAVTVNGHPQLSCETRLRDGQVVEPLAKFPVLRDLVVDRTGLPPDVCRCGAYLQMGDGAGDELPAGAPGNGAGAGDGPATPAPVLLEPKDRRLLAVCNECLACTAGCPEYRAAGPDDPFPGAMLFGRLALLAMDPRDIADRVQEARALGLERCLTCSGCRCPQGVPVWSRGVRYLLGEMQPDA